MGMKTDLYTEVIFLSARIRLLRVVCMKCDVVVYSNTAAFGLFFFGNWDNAPSVMFFYEAEHYNGNNSTKWTEKSLQEIKALGEYCVKNDVLTYNIKEALQLDDLRIGEVILECFYDAVAKMYSILSVKICPEHAKPNYYKKRKIRYTDLMNCCQIDMALIIINKLLKSDEEYDLIQALECKKILSQKNVMDQIIIPYNYFEKKAAELERRYAQSRR